MIRDEELKQAIDYSEGQKEAAYNVLGEITNLLTSFSENTRIIGSWVPTLLYPDSEHIGAIDADVLLNQLQIGKAEGYKTIRRLLEQHGYKRHPEKYFAYVKTVHIEGIDYEVDVDFLSGKYGGDGGNVSKHVDGLKTLPATGGNFAFEFPPTDVKIEFTREDGALDYGHVNVISIIPYLVMKATALGRGKPKDANEIYHVISCFAGGCAQKFASEKHAGPADVVAFLGIEEEEERKRARQNAYQKVSLPC